MSSTGRGAEITVAGPAGAFCFSGSGRVGREGCGAGGRGELVRVGGRGLALEGGRGEGGSKNGRGVCLHACL